MAISVSNEELRTVRDAMRELNQMIARLEAEEVEKFVLAKQHRMRAVVVSLDRYTALEHAAGLRQQAEVA